MVEVMVIPGQVFVEKGENGQYLNFDFSLKNPADKKLQILSIQVSVLDEQDKLMLRRFIDTNGIRPSIQTIGETELKERGQLFIFNPFHTLEAYLNFKKLHYEFLFSSDTGKKKKLDVVVTPTYYETKTNLILPLKGRIIVYDGHDFYSHHRRVDLTHPVAGQLGLRSNSGRYAYDFCVVDENGDLHRGSGMSNQDWFGFGTPVFAPGDGNVVAVVNNMKDNIIGKRVFGFQEALKNPDMMGGNQVVIDHRNGEFSSICHMKHGSIVVQEGDEVHRGQLIGQMGFSGLSGSWVHIHYELRNGIDFRTSEGLPSYFKEFRRIRGAKTVMVKKGRIDTGDIVETL